MAPGQARERPANFCLTMSTYSQRPPLPPFPRRTARSGRPPSRSFRDLLERESEGPTQQRRRIPLEKRLRRVHVEPEDLHALLVGQLVDPGGAGFGGRRGCLWHEVDEICAVARIGATGRPPEVVRPRRAPLTSHFSLLPSHPCSQPYWAGLASAAMCGIVGCFGNGTGQQTLPAVRRALAGLVHRGPDDGGVLVYDPAGGASFLLDGDDHSSPLAAPAPGETGVVLGHRRLAIIDPSPAGHQPMLTPDGSAAIILNGEIYNYLELRQELEAKGRARSVPGPTPRSCFRPGSRGAPRYCPGSSACSPSPCWTGAARRLVLARDQFGMKPLYYARAERRLGLRVRHRHPARPGRPAPASRPPAPVRLSRPRHQ